MYRRAFLCLGICLAMVFSSMAMAAEGPNIQTAGMLDDILNSFKQLSAMWGGVMQKHASDLFWTLASISMVWNFGFSTLKRVDTQEIFAELIRFIVVLGFFWWLLENGIAIATAIMDSLRKIASEASGFQNAMTPSGLVDVGFDIVERAMSSSSVWHPAQSTTGLAIACMILIILTLVATNMLLLLASAWLMIYAGVFVLGFGGGRWTQDIPIQYFRKILGLALHVFAMILVVGVGKSFIDRYYALMGQEILLKELILMLVMAIVLLAITSTLPPQISALVSGGGGGPGGGIGLGGLMAGGVAAVSAASYLGEAGKAAGSGVLGGVSALRAAYQAAQGELSEQGGGLGKLVTSMGSHLAQGASAVASESLGSVKDSVMERMSDTVGGRIAEAINQQFAAGDSPSSASVEEFKAGETGSIGPAPRDVPKEARDFVFGKSKGAA